MTVVKTTALLVLDADRALPSNCVRYGRQTSPPRWRHPSAGVTDERMPVTALSDSPPVYKVFPFMSITMDRVTSCPAVAGTTNRLLVDFHFLTGRILKAHVVALHG